MTLTAHDLNSRFKSDSFKPADWETLADLLVHLGIEDHRNYMFLGKRFENDSSPIHLVPESSLARIFRIVAISHHVGG